MDPDEQSVIYNKGFKAGQEHSVPSPDTRNFMDNYDKNRGEDMQRQIDNAKERGLFEGTVIQSLTDIKLKLNDMNGVQYAQDVKIALKCDKTDLDELSREFKDTQKRVYIFIGASSVISAILSLLGAAILKKFV